MVGPRSKRMGDPTHGSPHKKKKMSSRGSTSFEYGSLLVQCLRDHKLFLHSGENPHLLGVDQATFIKTFSKDVSTQLEYPNNIERMLDTLFQYLEDSTFLRKSLSPTKTSPECENAATELQDSFLRLLLCVPDFQSRLMSRLLEILAEVALTEEVQTQKKSQVEECSLPRLILSAVRFLPYIQDGAGLAEKMTEIIQACPTDIQREIILSLPEILEDAQHEDMAATLKEILDETRTLTCTVLDSLSSLSLSRTVQQELLEIVLKRLYRVTLTDLPSVVDFILVSAQGHEDLLAVIQELRERLDLSPPPATQTDHRAEERRKETQDIQCIVVENINLQATIHRPLCEAWLKVVEASVEEENQKPLDILLLVSFADISGRKKIVENIFKNKIRSGLFTERLLRATVTDYGSVVKKYFACLLAICDSLLRAPESGISSFGISMYAETFASLAAGDTYFQQELVGDLISKVGTGGGGIITDGALRSLAVLADRRSKELLVFTPMITAMMELTENMSLGQFRELSSILSTLAWQDSDQEEAGGLQNEINIMMKKQLCSKSPVLKKMGVIGAVNAVRAMGKLFSSEELRRGEEHRSGSSSSQAGRRVKNIMKLIDLVIAETRQYPEAAGLFMDELASPASMAEMPLRIAKECSERFQSKFENEFVEDVRENYERLDLGLPIQLALRLEEGGGDNSMEDDITIPIARWVLEAKMEPLDGKTEMLRFIPHFRLIGAIKKTHADEAEIDALLGCGVLMVPETYLSGKEDLRPRDLDSVCDIVFLSINWFREVLNYFSVSEDEDTRRFLLMRLKNTLYLEDSLRHLLGQNSQYRPPPVLFSEDTSGWTPPASSDKTKQKKGKGKEPAKGKGKGKGKRKNPVMNETTMNATMHLNTQVMPSPGPVASSTMIGQTHLDQSAAPDKKTADLGPYRPFFRELDLNVLRIFDFVVVTTESEPGYGEEKLDQKFRPAELLFLLKDLAMKAEKRLISASKKKGFPGRSAPASSFGNLNLMCWSEAEVAKKIAAVLPKIFANLDVIKDYFARLIRLNDGILDSGNLFSETSELYSQCIKHGFDIAGSLFSWNGFQSADMTGVLHSCLKGVVERLENVGGTGRPDAVSVGALAEKTVKYLLSFSENILSCEVAGSHLTLLDAVCRLQPTNPAARKAVAETAVSYCKRSWQSGLGREKSSVLNPQIDKFFTLSLDYAADPVAEMNSIFSEGVEDVFENKGKDYYNETYQTISRASLSVIYQVCLLKLATVVKKKTYGVTKDSDDLLDLWTATMDLLSKVVLPLKAWRNRSILKAVLKLSKPVLDHFIKHGMPLLDAVFKRKRTESIDILKTLQSSTRYLHVICTSTKTHTDLALANHVPFLKKSLEAVVYRVQAMLAANNCGDAFWVGNLKNRDLQGAEILTQVAEEEGEEEEGEGEEGDEGGEEEREVVDVGEEDESVNSDNED